MSFKRGDRVLYVPSHGPAERGIVKRMSDDGLAAFVLYDTGLMRYTEADLDNYTCARTSLSDLVAVPQVSREGG